MTTTKRNANGVQQKQWPGDNVTKQGQKQGAARQKRGPSRTTVAGEANAVQHANNTTGGEDAKLTGGRNQLCLRWGERPNARPSQTVGGFREVWAEAAWKRQLSGE